MTPYFTSAQFAPYYQEVSTWLVVLIKVTMIHCVAGMHGPSVRVYLQSHCVSVCFKCRLKVVLSRLWEPRTINAIYAQSETLVSLRWTSKNAAAKPPSSFIGKQWGNFPDSILWGFFLSHFSISPSPRWSLEIAVSLRWSLTKQWLLARVSVACVGFPGFLLYLIAHHTCDKWRQKPQWREVQALHDLLAAEEQLALFMGDILRDQAPREWRVTEPSACTVPGTCDLLITVG